MPHDAPSSGVRSECALFSILALLLFFLCQSIGIYHVTAYRILPSQIPLMTIPLYAGAIGCALLLPFLPARGKGFFSPLPLLATLAALLLCASHVLVRQGDAYIFHLRGFAVGIFWTLSLYGFFRFAPPSRRGLLLGLFIAAGELVWLLALPGTSAILPDASNTALTGHLQNIQIVVQGAIGVLLAASFALSPTDTSGKVTQAPLFNHGGTADTAKSKHENLFDHGDTAGSKHENPLGACSGNGAFAGVSVLPLLFMAATLFYVAYGLASGLTYPKTAPGAPDSAHLFLLIAMPLAGTLLDRGGRGCRLAFAVLACLAFSAPALVFIREGIAQEALHVALCVGRQGVFLATLLLADRLLRNRRRLPLLAALAYALPVMSWAGSALVHAGEATLLVAGAALGLALGFAFLAYRLRIALTGLSVAQAEDLPKPEPVMAAFDPVRLAAFGVTYGLSKQEMLVMEMLVEQRSTKDIARMLGVTDNTVHTYVRRLIKKTGVQSRARLMAHFAAQSASPAASDSQPA